MTDLVNLVAITKSFGGIHALKGVDFAVRSGEIHALLGENGAGKSTLMRVLGGEMHPSSGRIEIAGKQVSLGAPSDARALGIAVIHQEFALAPDLSVAENIFLGELPPDSATAKRPWAAMAWPAVVTKKSADFLSRPQATRRRTHAPPWF